MTAELSALEARREPARAAAAEQRERAEAAAADRDRAAQALEAQSLASEAALREIEGLEADVEAARSEVFSAINSATALRHSLEHAATARDRVAEALSKLQVEADDVRMQSERAAADHAAASDLLRRAQSAMEATRIERTARESELASARIEHEWRSQSIRAREQELAGLEARLKSLEELEAARAEYDDAARAVLAQANGKVGQQGAVADYLEVSTGYERAVEACLGDLLQHVVVESAEHAAAGLQLLREQRAGRCGFLIASRVAGSDDRDRPLPSRSQDRVRPRRHDYPAVVGGQRDRAVRRGDSRRRWRGLDRAHLRAGRCREPRHAASGCHGSGRTVPRAEPRLRRLARRCPRHPRDQARHQGPPLADRRGTRRARPADGGDGRFRESDCPGDQRDCRAQRRAAQGRQGDRRPRRADAARRGGAASSSAESASSWCASAARPRKSGRRWTAARPKRANRSSGSMAISARRTSG